MGADGSVGIIPGVSGSLSAGGDQTHTSCARDQQEAGVKAVTVETAAAPKQAPVFKTSCFVYTENGLNTEPMITMNHENN